MRMPRASIIAVAASLALVGGATAQATDPPTSVSSFEYSSNMEPIGESLRPPPSAGRFNSDLAFWGDTAYQGTYDGFRIIDISDPAAPIALIDYNECFGNQGDVIIWEDILVRSWNSANTSPSATCDGESVPIGFEGLHIFDVSDPSDPDLLTDIPLPGCGSHTATAVPDPDNGRLLVYNGASSPACPIQIVEVPLSDPSEASLIPVPVAAGRSCHDIAVILGEAMLAACAGGNGFTMFSLGGLSGGTLTAPQLLYSVSLTGVSIGHAASFSWDGSILVFGHEPGGGSGARCQESSAEVDKTLFFFDAGTGAELGRWLVQRHQTAQENCTIHNFNVIPSDRKNILVSGNYQMGIAVIDFTDPSAAHQIAYADPAPLVPTQLGGDWSSYWYDGVIYEGDITRGLITWRLHDAAVKQAQTLGHLNPQTQETTIEFVGDPDPEPSPSPGPGGSETSAGPPCGGETVTIRGTGADDVLIGTNGSDVIAGGNGDDTILGRKGNDTLCGGRGEDELRGQRGNDRLLGQGDTDRLLGGPGQDRCSGGVGRDRGRGCQRGRI